MNSKIWKIATLFGVICLVMLVAVPIASAHHPVLVANLACDGTVTFTVTADLLASSRDNADVAVMDTSGGTQPVATGEFTAANNWSFSGSFTIPTTVTSDTLTPQALGVWGDGVAPSNGPSTTITRPGGCSSAPATEGQTPAPAPAATPPAAPATPAPAPPAAAPPATPVATPPPVVEQLPPDAYNMHRGAPLTPPSRTPASPPAPSPKPPASASGSTSFATTHVAPSAPFTPPIVTAAKPKLVSHTPPTTAG